MESTLLSGAKLNITPASFEDAFALQNALLESAKGIKFELDIANMDVTDFKDFIIGAATSKAVQSAVFKCLERATYNDIRVTRQLFDDPKLGENAREDYYEMVIKAVEVNCKPFFVRAFSALSSAFTAQRGTPRQ